MAHATDDRLTEYRGRRRFDRSAEPGGREPDAPADIRWAQRNTDPRRLRSALRGRTLRRVAAEARDEGSADGSGGDRR